MLVPLVVFFLFSLVGFYMSAHQGNFIFMLLIRNSKFD